MHDIYIRFYHKFLRDLGLVNTDEPAEKLFVQGMVHGVDGNKMSKSLGNVVDPMEIIKKYGADSLRLFLISQASPDSDFSWNDKGVQASNKFINKIVDYFKQIKLSKSSKKTESKINKTIKQVTQDVENIKYNLAVIKLRQLFENLEPEISKKDAESFLKMLSIFCPHIAEELFEKINNKSLISSSNWPEVDESKINEKLEKAEEAVDRTVSDIMNILKIIREKQNKEPTKVFVYVTPMEIAFYNPEDISKRVGKPTEIFAVNNKDKYDPKDIAKKAKFGKPGIFVE
jgi:leucyl-tRNA synthetase